MKSALKNKSMLIGAIGLAGFVLWAIGWLLYSKIFNGTFANPYIPQIDIASELLPPLSKSYLLGTDLYGRSLVETISSGIVYSFGIAFIVSILSMSIGAVVGYLAASGGSGVKFASDLLINLIFIFPGILIAILFMSIVGESYWGLVGALVFSSWPGYAKVARGETLRIMNLDYVESARAIGVGKLRMFFSIILPAMMPFLIIHFVLGLGGVIISESTLGFLGLGGSEFSWGSLLADGKNVLLEAPHLCLVLSLCLAMMVISLNLAGDGLRDILDPKSQG
jgi:ABC-type dipeptide/oligopeptide/nickel transport system permease subunit